MSTRQLEVPYREANVPAPAACGSACGAPVPQDPARSITYAPFSSRPLQQIRVNSVLRMRRPPDSLEPYQAHQPSSTNALGPFVVSAPAKRRPMGAVMRIPQEQMVDPPHLCQRLGALSSARSRATTARSIAGGTNTAGSGSTPGGRAKPLRAAPRSTRRSWREDPAPRSHGHGHNASCPSRKTLLEPRSPGAFRSLPGSEGPGIVRRSPEAPAPYGVLPAPP